MLDLNHGGLEGAGADGIPSCGDDAGPNHAPPTAKLRATKRVKVEERTSPCEAPAQSQLAFFGQNRPNCALCISCRLCATNPQATCDLCRNCVRCMAYHASASARGGSEAAS